MNSAPGEPNTSGRNSSSAQPRLGETLRNARLSLGIDQSRIWNDVRIAPEMLEALETGRYDQLPAPPYVRAFLGTLAKYLNLDGSQLVDMYEEESGIKHMEKEKAEQMAETSQDVSLLKPVMILPLIIAAILIIWLFAQLSSDPGSAGNEPDKSPLAVDSLELGATTNTMDSLVEDSLANLAKPDTIADDKIVETPTQLQDTTAKADEAAEMPEEPEKMTRVRITSVTDSVWIRVVRSGRPDYNRLLKH